MSRRSRSRRAPDWLPPPPRWEDRAACKGVATSVFYDETPAGVALAREHCRRCLVALECLTAALERGDRYGVWGGLDPDERRQLASSMAA